MRLEDKPKEELINLVKYYKSEWENVTRLCVSKNREITNLKKEITKLKKIMKGNNI